MGARATVAAVLLGLAGCASTSVADVEDRLWSSIKEEIPAAAKPDCPADARIEDGQSFTCEIQITEVGFDPTNPGKAATPKAVYRDVDVTVEGDMLNWEVGK
jgi:hypothetical protein